MHKLLMVLVLLATLALAGCAQHNWLADSDYVGGKQVSYVLTQAGTVSASRDNEEQLFHFVVRVCDYDAAGEETGCKDTLILTDIALGMP